MTCIRPFEPADLFRFNNINLDPFTETYGLSFYLHYLVNWPEYFQVAEHPGTGRLMGYIMGKAEGRDELWHGHVTAVSVAPEFRRMGLAGTLMENLERISEAKRCYFVDLFVRVSNAAACQMYNRLGYVVYRRIIDYYAAGGGGSGNGGNGSGGRGGTKEEDAFDMRKALSRDVEKKSMVPLKSAITADEIEFD